MNTIYIVTLSIFNEQNELLLVRKNGSKYFQLPGGKRRIGEDDLLVLSRELKEELQFDLGRYSLPTFLGEHVAIAVNEIDTKVVGRMYLLEVKEEDSFQNDNEIEEMLWVNPSNYLNITWANLVKEYVFPIWAKRNFII